MANSARRRCAARWTRILRDWARSGLKVAPFCRLRSISRPSFYAWKRRLGSAPRLPSAPRAAAAAASPPFLPVRVTAPALSAGPRTTLELELRGGRRVALSTDLPIEDLARLLVTLEGQPC